MGTETYYVQGTRLRNLPDPLSAHFYQLCQLYKAANKLLALRPWSQFASFEILKVTVQKTTTAPFTKSIMFFSTEIYKATDLTNSSFGHVQFI
jgi:hypothetical protein